MDSYKGKQGGITDIKTVNFSYSWTINNFSFNRSETGQAIDSPVFYMSDKQDYEWYICLYPKGQTDKCKDYISIFLQLHKAPVNPNISTKVTFSVLNRKNEEKYSCKMNYVFDEVTGRGFTKFIERSILSTLKNDLLLDDKLTIMCKVTAGLGKIEHNSKDFVKFEDKSIQFKLSNELESLLKNQHMADVTLVANGKELKAHKTILVARSPVFLAMLQTDMQEKQTCKIEFADVSIDVLNEMLQYLYTGEVKKIKDYAYDLVKLADKYDIKGLKLMCEKVFHSELCVNNVIKLFILADHHNCDVLRPLILKFMIANAKDIIKTVDFKKFEKDLPVLVKEMMQAVI